MKQGENMHNFAPTIIARKMRFALVGCSRIASNHFGAIVRHQDRCKLVDALSDFDEVAAASL
jgi:UDP-N-acetyl-2-amino-2-deoxyglucuronate dehydrogenase